MDQYRRNPETGQLERYQIEIPIEEKIISQPLKKEFDYYLKNQDELVSKYNGRIVVIKNCQILGDYDSTIEAIEKTSKNHEMGTFLVQKCEPGEESYTVRY